MPFVEFASKRIRLTDAMREEVYERDGGEIIDPGLYIDHAPWQLHVLELQAI